MKLEERFWNKVNKSGECWLWIGGISGNGYGIIKTNNKSIGTHRMSWFLSYGKQSKKCVLHKCDNRSCVNPLHLFEGTKKDNALDMISKGRHYEQKVIHCPNNHVYNISNTYLHKNKRSCRQCKKESVRKWKIINPERSREINKKYEDNRRLKLCVA